MSVYSRIGANFAGGYGLGERMHERAMADDFEARKRASEATLKQQYAELQRRMNGEAMEQPPAAQTALPVEGEAPAPAPVSYPRRSDWTQYSNAVFNHALEFGGGLKEAVDLTSAFESRLTADGLRLLSMGREAFKAGDMQTAVRFLQGAYSSLPNGMLPAFKVSPDGKLVVGQVDENTGELVGDPMVVTDQMLEGVERAMTMEKKDRVTADQDAAELEQKTEHEAAVRANTERHDRATENTAFQNSKAYLLSAYSQWLSVGAAMERARNAGKDDGPTPTHKLNAGKAAMESYEKLMSIANPETIKALEAFQPQLLDGLARIQEELGYDDNMAMNTLQQMVLRITAKDGAYLNPEAETPEEFLDVEQLTEDLLREMLINKGRVVPDAEGGITPPAETAIPVE